MQISAFILTIFITLIKCHSEIIAMRNRYKIALLELLAEIILTTVFLAISKAVDFNVRYRVEELF